MTIRFITSGWPAKHIAHSFQKRTLRSRGAYTLIELIVAIGASTILLVGLPSSILIASKGLQGNSTVSRHAQSADVLQDVINDLKHATSFVELTTIAVTFTVPDRDNDGDPELIRYSWSGTPGDPLMYQYNSGTAVIFAEDIHKFDVRSLTRAVAAPIIPDPVIVNPVSSLIPLSPSLHFVNVVANANDRIQG
ncbi:MAG: type II secretion system protein J [Planctomycetaceae bacterium]